MPRTIETTQQLCEFLCISSPKDSELKYRNCFEASKKETRVILSHFATMMMIVGIGIKIEDNQIISASVDKEANTTIVPQDANFLYFSISDHGMLVPNFVASRPSKIELCIPLQDET